MSLFRGFVRTCVFLTVACSPQLPTPPKPASTLEARREQDLDYLVEIIDTVHPDPFLRCSETEFRTEVEEIRREIPELDDTSFHLALLRLLTSLQDAHCGMWSLESSDYPLAMPCSVERFDEGYFVNGCAKGHHDLLGARIVSIDGHSFESLVDRCAEIIPAANPQRVAYKAPKLLMAPRLLHDLGLARHVDRYTIEFELPNGEKITRELATGEPDFKSGTHVFHGVEDLPSTIHPTPHTTGAPYWWEYRPDERMLYLQYNAVQTHDDYPFDEMVTEFLSRIDRGDIETIVVDVRYSGGGNNGLIDPLDDGLAMRARRGELGRLYVLVSGRTFSSGVDVAVRIRDNASATVVGTPTGGMPNSFGNALDFTLPNSGIEGWCSTGYFRLVDGEPPTLEPDVDVGRPWADYSIGRDTAMEWVLSQDEGTHEK